MPDMQTALRSALTKTLQQWDDDGEESPQASSTISTTINNSLSAPSKTIQGIPMTKPTINQHRITNNVSRVTFNYVRDNPGSTRQEIIKELGYQGFTKGSVSSLLAQMRRAGMAHDTGGLWYADFKEYAPIKNMNYKSKAKPKAVKKATTGIGTLLRAKLESMPEPSQDAMDAAAYAMGGPQPTAPKQYLTKLVRTQAPEDIIGNMTVYQARELYLHLKSMFGG